MHQTNSKTRTGMDTKSGRISYHHGVSDKKLIGETIGNFFDRTVAAHRDLLAKVKRLEAVVEKAEAMADALTPIGLEYIDDWSGGRAVIEAHAAFFKLGAT